MSPSVNVKVEGLGTVAFPCETQSEARRVRRVVEVFQASHPRATVEQWQGLVELAKAAKGKAPLYIVHSYIGRGFNQGGKS